MSSILHMLQVDKYADSEGLESAFASGGMNFGNIAVYECEDHCDGYLVIQDSLDDQPVKQTRAQGDDDSVIIDENAKFDDDDEEDGMDEDNEEDE